MLPDSARTQAGNNDDGQLVPVCGQLIDIGTPHSVATGCLTQCCRVIGNLVLDHCGLAEQPTEGHRTAELTASSCSCQPQEMPRCKNTATDTRLPPSTAIITITIYFDVDGDCHGHAASYKSRNWGIAESHHRHALVLGLSTVSEE